MMIKQKFLVNLEDDYTADKIRSAFQRHREGEEGSKAVEWTETSLPAEASLLWQDYESINWEAYHKQQRPSSLERELPIINSYCIRKGLIRKSQNAQLIEMYAKKRPMSLLSTAFPLTLLFNLDCIDYLDEALNECFEVRDGLARNERILSGEESGDLQVFVMKPSLTNRADGIFVFRTMLEFEEYLEGIFDEDSDSDEDESDRNFANDCKEWVIQEFLDKPLLINQRKFHVRAYCLAVGKMDVYLFDDMLALFASKPYVYLGDSSLSDFQFDPLIHITNTCVQSVKNEDFNEEEAVQRFWDIAAAGELMDEKRAAFRQMARIMHDLFDAMTHSPTQFQPMDTAFEVYGMDFLIDEDWRVYFLEANAFPDFAQTGERLGKLVGRFFEKSVGVITKTMILKESYEPQGDIGEDGELWPVYSTRAPSRIPFEHEGR